MRWNVLRPAVGGVILLAMPVFAGAAAAAKTAPEPGNFDVRVGARQDLSRVVAQRAVSPLRPAPTPSELRAQIQAMQAALSKLRTVSPGATVRFSPVTVAPEIVAGERGALSALAPSQSGFDIVRGFLHANSALYGLGDAEIDALHFLGESVSPRNGMRM